MFNKIVFPLLLISLFCVAGCSTPAPVEESPFSKVKVRSLAPTKYNTDPNEQRAITSFSIYTFSVPAENLKGTVEALKPLRKGKLRANDEWALKSNYIMTGVGISNDWKAISEKLKALGAQQERLAISTMPAGTDESFKIIVLDDEISMFYSDGNGPAKGISVGPGNLVFKLRATAVDGQRGVCELSITPAFEPFEALGRKALTIKQYKEFVFEQLAIEAELGPGDFVVFAPANYAPDDATITSTFFQKPGLASAVQFFVFVCTGVAD